MALALHPAYCADNGSYAGSSIPLACPLFFLYTFGMVISSIDLKDGKVVQLKNGKEPVLSRTDADSLAAEFNIYGETAVIDLDAALTHTDEGPLKGQTPNSALLASLLRKGNMRAGGGIRTVKRAKELISLGAEKVIIGSAAFAGGSESRKSGSGAQSVLNTDFLDELVKAIGKQRIIIAVDARDGIISVKGWTQSSGIPLLDGARAAEKYAGELLFTCVEKEGCMGGTDMEAVRSLRQAVQCRLTAAGGVSSVREVEELEKLGVDVQLGMALYTGAVKLKDCFIACLNWDKAEKHTGGLIPVIAQSTAGEVLMTGFANRAAFEKTFDTKKLTFWSRSRNCLWTKGETSGNTLSVVKIRADCDRDTVLAVVEPAGPSCHTGSWTCFSSEGIARSNLERLEHIIAERFAHPTPGSYTATLDDKRVREKIAEESQELIEANGKNEVVWEAADLMYFIGVLLHRENVRWQDVYDELDRRHKK